ncbi:hypothetical protein TWF225_005557 [Orbilia oligospora]|uniref:Uncharacterized protein n=1 Tax=Orbilia oligospora TaxID=2813651 RepID=A0A7C8PQY1_ORBOL|nr:hypothetical protein TWF751_005463 [Orbilia oligospora]KAF3194942.1 hypothetical protein TWF225_005557 [Orbilia oligospora]KAF3259805.1 hypothetical protein TWF128_003804 [Orbilia oligospora]KAF3270883.1 hypothetical protein TWF217_007155 [Orbilia oligospora]KAF3292367.1 hypothetical protein TWF132_005755 [Orbilia oligospora]
METSTSQIPSSFRFLDLPPEIRNEIYAHVLTNISIPSCRNRFRGPGMQHWRYPERDADSPRLISLNPGFANGPGTDEGSTNPRLFELLSRCMTYVGDISGIPQTKLALLRVNRQIHDEAARVFYGGNVFKIEVSIAVRMRMRPVGSMHTTYPRVYDTSYTAPWERFGYQLLVDPEESTSKGQFIPLHNSVYDEGDTRLSPEYLQTFQNNANLLLYPSSIYSPLIRKINIEFKIDQGSLSGNNDSNTPSIQTLLLPFLWRLRQQLTEKATVEIKIDLSSYLMFLHLSRPSRAFDGMPGLKTNIEDSLEAGYIFSLGPWKSTFNDIPQVLEKTWQEVLGKCKKRPEFRDDILQKMMQELDVGLREGSFWGKREGVLAVFLPMPGAPVIPPTLVPSSDQ